MATGRFTHRLLTNSEPTTCPIFCRLVTSPNGLFPTLFLKWKTNLQQIEVKNYCVVKILFWLYFADFLPCFIFWNNLLILPVKTELRLTLRFFIIKYLSYFCFCCGLIMYLYTETCKYIKDICKTSFIRIPYRKRNTIYYYN